MRKRVDAGVATVQWHVCVTVNVIAPFGCLQQQAFRNCSTCHFSYIFKKIELFSSIDVSIYCHLIQVEEKKMA